MKYPKIHSLWKREGHDSSPLEHNRPLKSNKHSLIIGDYSCAEFGNIEKWRVEEKIDGTNIRIHFSCSDELGPMRPIFMGRTDDAQIPCHLFQYLQTHFTQERLQKLFPNVLNVFLFGEGYGPKIQKDGEKYAATPGFILFDVYINGWWMEREDVHDIARKLQIRACPDLGMMSEPQIVAFVRSRPRSIVSEEYGFTSIREMEGVVCRPNPLMLFRHGEPIMWKLKCRDFDFLLNKSK